MEMVENRVYFGFDNTLYNVFKPPHEDAILNCIVSSR